MGGGQSSLQESPGGSSLSTYWSNPPSHSVLDTDARACTPTPRIAVGNHSGTHAALSVGILRACTRPRPGPRCCPCAPPTGIREAGASHQRGRQFSLFGLRKLRSEEAALPLKQVGAGWGGSLHPPPRILTPPTGRAVVRQEAQLWVACICAPIWSCRALCTTFRDGKRLPTGGNGLAYVVHFPVCCILSDLLVTRTTFCDFISVPLAPPPPLPGSSTSPDRRVLQVHYELKGRQRVDPG